MAIVNGYCTLAQVKAALRITDTTDDTLIENSVEAASRLIDGHAMRNFYSSPQRTPSTSRLMISPARQSRSKRAASPMAYSTSPSPPPITSSSR
jgi:hypothetical protein